MKALIHVSLGICIVVCGGICTSGGDRPTQTGLVPAPGVFFGGNEGYFPPDAFSSNTNLQEQLAARYLKHLQAMGEPSLLKVTRTESNAVYRFLWLRSFHEPVTVRLKVLGDGSV